MHWTNRIIPLTHRVAAWPKSKNLYCDGAFCVQLHQWAFYFLCEVWVKHFSQLKKHIFLVASYLLSVWFEFICFMPFGWWWRKRERWDWFFNKILFIFCTPKKCDSGDSTWWKREREENKIKTTVRHRLRLVRLLSPKNSVRVFFFVDRLLRRHIFFFFCYKY